MRSGPLPERGEVIFSPKSPYCGKVLNQAENIATNKAAGVNGREDNMASKSTFVIDARNYTALETLDNSQRGILFSAIMLYQLGEPLPDMDAATRMAFDFLRVGMDINNDKYKATCEARSRSGKKGGRPRNAETHEEFKDSDEKSKKSKEKQLVFEKAKKAKETKKADCDNECECDCECDKEEYDSNESYRSQAGTYDHIIDLWNTLAQYGIPKIKTIDGERRRLVRARLKQYEKQYGDKVFDEIIARIRGSDFLQGKSDNPFLLSFDWAIKPRNCAKILEGNYENRGDYDSAYADGRQKGDIVRTILSGVNRDAIGV